MQTKLSTQIFKFKHHLFMIKPHTAAPTTVPGKTLGTQPVHETKLNYKTNHRYLKEDTLHGRDQRHKDNPGTQQQLRRPMPY
jgi:hypothetical protein